MFDRERSGAVTQGTFLSTLSVADALPQPVWTARPDGGVDYVNAAWCSYTGLSVAASLDDGWLAALHPDDLVATTEQWRQAADFPAP